MAEIKLERREDGVALLTLDAPDRRNALTVAMAHALIAACEVVDADDTVGAVVVAGEGGYFCAGGDRATLAAAGRDPAEHDAPAAVARSTAPSPASASSRRRRSRPSAAAPSAPG